jgi:hypothetical protein
MKIKFKFSFWSIKKRKMKVLIKFQKLVNSLQKTKMNSIVIYKIIIVIIILNKIRVDLQFLIYMIRKL